MYDKVIMQIFMPFRIHNRNLIMRLILKCIFKGDLCQFSNIFNPFFHGRQGL